MAVSGSIMHGQVSFPLGAIPIFIAWIYSEFLEYKISASHSRVQSDNNLVELGDEIIKKMIGLFCLKKGSELATLCGANACFYFHL